MRFGVLILFLLLLLVNCNKSVEDFPMEKDDKKESENVSIVPIKHMNKVVHHSKTVNGITYSFKSVSALEYLANKGVEPEEDDIRDLDDERVIIMEFSEEVYDIFKSKKLQLSQDDLIMYLCDGIKEDVTIIQEGKSTRPNAVQYEGKIGSGDRIRATFFLTGIRDDSPFQIQFYDKIFGNGFVKIKLDNNRAIV